MSPNSSLTLKAREDRAIYRALGILEKRMSEPGISISSPGDARNYLTLKLGELDKEVFAVLFLDAQNRLIASEIMFTGTLTQTRVYPREVVRRALYHNAASVMFAHNHPSGRAEQSRADEMLTRALKEALSLVDVRVLDHFVIGGKALMSFAERGLI